MRKVCALADFPRLRLTPLQTVPLSDPVDRFQKNITYFFFLFSFLHRIIFMVVIFFWSTLSKRTKNEPEKGANIRK